MTASHSATYVLSDGKTWPATVFVSSVTITIRYMDENNRQQDVNWLEKELSGFEEKTGRTEIRHIDSSGNTERLIITDPALVQTIKKRLRHNRLIGKPHHRVLSKLWTKVLIIAGIVVALLLVAYLWFVPWLGERVAMNFSKENEILLGNQMYKTITTTFTIDDHKTELVNTFYKQLQYSVDYPVEITVVESDVVNAFAIPGGHIVVYDAILKKMKTPEELAALLGHEVSHVALRHSLRNMFRSYARKMFLALVLGNEAGIVNVLADNADNLKGLEYSRLLETEADNYGLQLMAKSGLDPQGMVKLMQLLEKESDGKEPSSLLSTHPVMMNRIENINKQIQTLTPAARDNSALKKTFHDIFANW